MSELMIIFIMLCGVLGLVGFVVSLICVAMVAGFLRSTHTVQYVPHETTLPTELSDEELLEENEKALLSKVGKKSKEEPTVVDSLDSYVEEVLETSITF